MTAWNFSCCFLSRKVQLAENYLTGIPSRSVVQYLLNWGRAKEDTGLLDEPGLEGRQTLRRTWTWKDARLLDEPGL
ncbi:unnamed protein product [Rhizophagus irregularis]|nr:unnamed protein product [Rhizophagus irregularis]